jgi:hypothetical protein
MNGPAQSPQFLTPQFQVLKHAVLKHAVLKHAVLKHAGHLLGRSNLQPRCAH